MSATKTLVTAEDYMRGGLTTFAPSAFRTIRRRSKVSAADLAITIGVSESTVNKWESGVATPRPDHLLAIARAFRRPTTDFLRLPDQLRLRHLREIAGLTTIQVGEMTGKTATTISRIEAGSSRPGPAVVEVMANAYSVTPQEIVDAWDREVERVKLRTTRALGDA